ncbi:hypothetical protein EDD17DRAFT_1504576 [Pisolithus thermaeus]|nr:hypothetical protein EDD17DRAFT_1504576 [Pisolithus thermaeus]
MPWRRVGIGNINKPSTRNMAIEAPSSTDPETTFGRPASPNEGRVLSRADGNKAEVATSTQSKSKQRYWLESVRAHIEARTSKATHLCRRDNSQPPESDPTRPSSRDVVEDELNSKLETLAEYERERIPSRDMATQFCMLEKASECLETFPPRIRH